MRKLLIVPVLLPVVGAAAVYGYYWYQVKDHADRLVAQLAPFGELNYDKVVAGFDGVAGIESLSFRPLGQEAELTAERLVVEANTWTDLVKLSQSQEDGLPSQMAVRLEGLDIDMQALPVAGDSGQACQSVAVNGATLWRELGYQRLQANLSAGYEFSPANGYLKLNLEMDAPSAFKMNLSSSLEVGPVMPKLATLLPQARLSELGIRYQDDSYNARLRRYCAQQTGLPEELYVAQLSRETAAHYQQMGLQVGESLLQAYRSFLQSQGVIDARVVAKTPLPLLGLSNATLNDFATQLTVNSQSVTPLDISWQPAQGQPNTSGAGQSGLLKTAVANPSQPRLEADKQPQTGASSSGQPTQPAEVAPAEQPAVDEETETLRLTPVKRPPKPEYREVRVEELEQHLGKQLQVDTRNGHRIEGTLEALVRRQLRVRQEMDGGVAILPIRFDLISRVRVKD